MHCHPDIRVISFTPLGILSDIYGVCSPVDIILEIGREFQQVQSRFHSVGDSDLSPVEGQFREFIAEHFDRKQ